MNDSFSCCGPVAKILLVLLRIAVGWHLLYEGLYKLNTYTTATPWSSRAYLERSEGPLSNYFRGLAGNSSAETEIDESEISASWSAYRDRFDSFYGLDVDQRESADGEQRDAEQRVRDELFDEPQLRRVLEQYQSDAAATPDSLTTSEQWRMEANRSRLRAKIFELTDRYHSQLRGLLTDEQLELGNLAGPDSTLATVDRLVTWGLILCGAGLLVGLFSRLSALGGAVMLLLFYLAMPPWPGLSGVTDESAHYLYVNKNLIEAIALLLLATTNSGRWAGLDALVRAGVTAPLGRIGHKKKATRSGDVG